MNRKKGFCPEILKWSEEESLIERISQNYSFLLFSFVLFMVAWFGLRGA